MSTATPPALFFGDNFGLRNSDLEKVLDMALAKKADYADLFSSPYQAAARGYIDVVIMPRETRRWLIRSLDLARTKRIDTPKRKHGNIPL